jgi:hypothetical protein
MQRGQSWLAFKGILWSLLHWFTIPMVYCKGLPSPWYTGNRQKSAEDGHHRRFPRGVDPGQATSRERLARGKPTLTNNNGGQNDLNSHSLGYFTSGNHLRMDQRRCQLILDAIRSLRFVEIGAGWWVYLYIYAAAALQKFSTSAADPQTFLTCSRRNGKIFNEINKSDHEAPFSYRE